jgi:hypothetical protein
VLVTAWPAPAYRRLATEIVFLWCDIFRLGSPDALRRRAYRGATGGEVRFVALGLEWRRRAGVEALAFDFGPAADLMANDRTSAAYRMPAIGPNNTRPLERNGNA